MRKLNYGDAVIIAATAAKGKVVEASSSPNGLDVYLVHTKTSEHYYYRNELIFTEI